MPSVASMAPESQPQIHQKHLFALHEVSQVCLGLIIHQDEHGKETAVLLGISQSHRSW